MLVGLEGILVWMEKRNEIILKFSFNELYFVPCLGH